MFVLAASASGLIVIAVGIVSAVTLVIWLLRLEDRAEAADAREREPADDGTR